VIELFVSSGNLWRWADLSELTAAPLPCSISLVGYDWYNGKTKQVAYVDDRRHLIELFVATGNPWQWVDLTELTGAPLPVQGSLAGYDWLNGNTKQLVYGDEQGHVIELWGGFGANGIMRSYCNRQKEDRSETTESMGFLGAFQPLYVKSTAHTMVGRDIKKKCSR
jgi:hypothetical protein